MMKKLLKSGGMWVGIVLAGLLLFKVGTCSHYYATRTPQQKLADSRGDWRVVECDGKYAVQIDRGGGPGGPGWTFYDCRPNKHGAVWEPEKDILYNTLEEAEQALEEVLKSKYHKAYWKPVK